MEIDRNAMLKLLADAKATVAVLESLLEQTGKGIIPLDNPYRSLISVKGVQLPGHCLHRHRQYYCPHPAITAQGYCLTHDPDQRQQRAEDRIARLCKATRRDGQPCKELRKDGSELCRTHAAANDA